MPSQTKRGRELKANLEQWPDLTAHSNIASLVLEATRDRLADCNFVLMAYPKTWGDHAKYQKTRNGAIIQIRR